MVLFFAKGTICWPCSVGKHEKCIRKGTKKRYDCLCFTCFGDNL